MISYIRHNSVFDLGSRTGTSTCVGLYKELDDIYSKYINPQVRVQYDNTDCLCNMSGKQTLSGGSHAFVFHNGTISVTVDEQDNVTIADSGSGGGGGGLAIHVNEDGVMDKTWQEIHDAIIAGVIPLIVMTGKNGTAAYYKQITWAYISDGLYVITARSIDAIETEYKTDSASGFPKYPYDGGGEPVG